MGFINYFVKGFKNNTMNETNIKCIKLDKNVQQYSDSKVKV